MSTPRRRILRPAPVPSQPHLDRRIHKLQSRLEEERKSLARWMTRLKRAFHTVEKVQQRITRIGTSAQPTKGVTMSALPEQRTITVVSACMNADGTPGFVLNTALVTADEAANGRHYELVEQQLLDDGYEEPFVHFDQNEAPDFLHAAVRQYLGLSPIDTDETNPLIVEELDGSHH